MHAERINNFMSVRRKSNWYIYFIAFAITLAFAAMAIFAFRWYLFPTEKTNVGLDESGGLAEDFIPDSSYNFGVMAMISESASDAPGLFVMITYDAVNNRVTFIPIPPGISRSSDGTDLPGIYSAQGGAGVIGAVAKHTGITCSSYVKLDRKSFISFATAFGNVETDVPKTIIIPDGAEAETINSGRVLFTSEMLYRYIMLADFEEGESYRFNMIGNILSEMVNQNIPAADSSLLDTYARMLINAPDTDLTAEKYAAHKAAFLNTIMYESSPAEYYIPYGQYSDDGGFEISENSVITIKQKAGVE